MHLYVLYQKQVSFPNPKMSHRNIPRNLVQPTSSPQALRVEVWTWRPPPSRRSFPGIASGNICFFYTYVFEYLAHVYVFKDMAPGTFILTYFLANILTLFLAFYLASFQAFIRAFFLASILTFSLTFFMAFYLIASLTSNIQSNTRSVQIKKSHAHTHKYKYIKTCMYIGLDISIPFHLRGACVKQRNRVNYGRSISVETLTGRLKTICRIERILPSIQTGIYVPTINKKM